MKRSAQKTLVALFVAMFFVYPAFGVVTYVTTPSADPYNPDSGGELVNGIFETDFYGNDWSSYDVGANGQLEIVFDFSQQTGFEAIGVCHRNASGFAEGAPVSIEYSFSSDGVTFSSPVIATSFILIDGIFTDYVDINGSSEFRYIKAIISADSDGFLTLSEFDFVPIGEVTYTRGHPDIGYGNVTDSGRELVNGIFETNWYGKDYSDYDIEPNGILTFVFDFHQMVQFTAVGLSHRNASGIARGPASIQYSFSTDGVTFGSPMTQTQFVTMDGFATGDYFDISGSPECRYIKASLETDSEGMTSLSEFDFVPAGELVYSASHVHDGYGVDHGLDLVDGIVETRYWDGWVVYNVRDTAKTMDIVFNFNSTVQYNAVDISYRNLTYYNHDAPNNITFSFSNDGITYTSPVVVTNFNNSDGPQRRYVELPGAPSTYRFIKAVAKAGTGGILTFSEFTFRDAIAGDLDKDGDVDIDDLGMLADAWLNFAGHPEADLNGDSEVNYGDFAVLAGNWMIEP